MYDFNQAEYGGNSFRSETKKRTESGGSEEGNYSSQRASINTLELERSNVK